MIKYGLRRLKIQITQIAILSSVLCPLSSVIYAQPVSSGELIANAREYDGKSIVYEAEVVGEPMVRGAYAWVNLYDGENAIGVWMDAAGAQAISYSGGYKTKGDILEVSGIFHRACPEHGGDLDIHAQAVRKVKSGRNLTERMNPDKKQVAVILAGVFIAIWIFSLFKKR